MFNPPPDGHLKHLGPVTVFPFRAFFLRIEVCERYLTVTSPGSRNIVHVFDDLVTLASGCLEAIPVEDVDLAAIVADELA